MIRLLKPLSFLPAIMMMYLIFSFSAQDSSASSQLSYKVSYEIVEAGSRVIGADLESWEIDSLANRFHGAIRKLAHMAEYFALAVAVSFPLYVYGLRGILLMIVAGLFCVAFACGDEYHQSYVAGRAPSRRDVLIDSFGIFWGIVLVRIIGWTGRKTIFRPFCNKKKKKDGVQPVCPPPTPSSVSYYPPRNDGNQNQPYSYDFYQNQPYPTDHCRNQPYPPDRYRNQPYPSDYYRNQPYPHEPGYGNHPVSRDNGTSDRLSEDMSLKKLMHDIKDQKREEKYRK